MQQVSGLEVEVLRLPVSRHQLVLVLVAEELRLPVSCHQQVWALAAEVQRLVSHQPLV